MLLIRVVVDRDEYVKMLSGGNSSLRKDDQSLLPRISPVRCIRGNVVKDVKIYGAA